MITRRRGSMRLERRDSTGWRPSATGRDPGPGIRMQSTFLSLSPLRPQRMSPRPRDIACGTKWRSTSTTSSSDGPGFPPRRLTEVHGSPPRSSRRWGRNWVGTRVDGPRNSRGSRNSPPQIADGGMVPTLSDPIVPVIVNPKAANGGARRYASPITKTLTRAGFRVSSPVTPRPMDAARIAREALSAGRELVLAVGGDGTVNEVVNGLLSGGGAFPPSTALAVAQVGTGTDFSRTFGWTSDPEEVLDRLRRNRRLPIDVGRVEYTDLDGRPASRFFVNIAEFGSGGAVVEKVNRTTKVLGGRMSVLLAILSR